MLDHPLLVEGARALLEGVLNGSVQSIALVCVLFPLIRWLAPASPDVRHGVWLIALLTMVGLHVASTIGALGSGVAEAVPSRTLPSTGAVDVGRLIAPEGSAAAGGTGLLIEIPGSGWSQLIVAALLLAIIVRLLLVGRGVHYWRRLRARSEPLSEELAALTDAVPDGVFPRKLRVGMSREVSCPVTMGYLHPTILLPLSLPAELSALELRQILAHEVAHVQRYDDWTNLVQRLIEAVLFFNPAVLWIGRRMEMERELACDQHVLARVGGRKEYASCLLRLATNERFAADGLVTGAAACRLTERVETMLRAPQSPAGARSSRALCLVVPAALLLIVAGSRSLPLSVAIAADDRSREQPAGNGFEGQFPREAPVLAASPSGSDLDDTGVTSLQLSGFATDSAPAASLTSPAAPRTKTLTPDGASPTPSKVAIDHVPEVTPYVCAAGTCSQVQSTLPGEMVRTVSVRAVLPTRAATSGQSGRPRRGLTVVASGSGRAPTVGTPGATFEQPRKSGLTTSGASAGTVPDNRPTVDDLSPMRVPTFQPVTSLR